jgi:ferredoxin--NADP+ reductase
VALDVARILTIDPARLEHTDIDPRALAALRQSRIEEVMIVGRRGPAQSSFTVPELVGLSNTPGIDLVVDRKELPDPARAKSRKLGLLRSLDATSSQNRTIRLRYLLSPTRIAGGGRVEAVDFSRNRLDADGRATKTLEHETIDAGLVLTSIGYRGVPVGDLPFDPQTGTVTNDHGRVRPGTYVAGWIKRGPTGFIGTNRSCSQETVRRLVDDWNAARLTAQPAPVRNRGRELKLAA